VITAQHLPHGPSGCGKKREIWRPASKFEPRLNERDGEFQGITVWPISRNCREATGEYYENTQNSNIFRQIRKHGELDKHVSPKLTWSERKADIRSYRCSVYKSWQSMRGKQTHGKCCIITQTAIHSFTHSFILARSIFVFHLRSLKNSLTEIPPPIYKICYYGLSKKLSRNCIKSFRSVTEWKGRRAFAN
jgi:hypothetical protein